MNQEAIEQAIQVLNEALKLDPNATNTLLMGRMPCNAALANHPSIQVSAKGEKWPGQPDEQREFSISALGLINGLFGVYGDDRGYIAAMVNTDTGRIEAFTWSCSHDFEAIRAGGSPAEASSYERVRVCKRCGMEDPGLGEFYSEQSQ